MSAWSNHLYSLLAVGFCLILGKAIYYLTPALPSNLYGMLLLTTLLHYRVINAEKMKASVQWVLRHMGVCFVPAGVGIMAHQTLLKEHGLNILFIVVLTTLALMLFVAWSYQTLNKKQSSKEGGRDD